MAREPGRPTRRSWVHTGPCSPSTSSSPSRPPSPGGAQGTRRHQDQRLLLVQVSDYGFGSHSADFLPSTRRSRATRTPTSPWPCEPVRHCACRRDHRQDGGGGLTSRTCSSLRPADSRVRPGEPDGYWLTTAEREREQVARGSPRMRDPARHRGGRSSIVQRPWTYPSDSRTSASPYSTSKRPSRFTVLGLTVLAPGHGQWRVGRHGRGFGRRPRQIAMLQTRTGEASRAVKYIHPKAIWTSPTPTTSVSSGRLLRRRPHPALEIAALAGCHPLRGVSDYEGGRQADLPPRAQRHPHRARPAATTSRDDRRHPPSSRRDAVRQRLQVARAWCRARARTVRGAIARQRL